MKLLFFLLVFFFYIEKKTILFIASCVMMLPFVSLQSNLLLYWHGFVDVSVMLCDVSVTLSKQTLQMHLGSDSMELA